MNKRIVILFVFLAFYTVISAQNINCKILVKIENIPSDEGQMIVALHNNKEDFPKSPIKKLLAKIVNGQSTIVFENLKNGYYAITAIHDKNNNGKLDFNFLHIPKEDVCTSNNAKGFIGPPDYSDAKFEVSDTLVIQSIQMD